MWLMPMTRTPTLPSASSLMCYVHAALVNGCSVIPNPTEAHRVPPASSPSSI